MSLEEVKTLAIFGTGITATAVREKLTEFPAYTEVSPDESPDVGIISPGLRTEEYLSKYSFPIISEIEWALYLFKNVDKTPKFIAISGTNGKTTTTHLISHLLNIPMAGNVGIPLIRFVSPEISLIPDQISLEISSYQLEQSPAFQPDIYVLLNITEDHLDRHETMKNYAEIKLRPAHHQHSEQFFIYNGQDTWIQKMLPFPDSLSCQCIDFTKKQADFSDEIQASPLLGNHNVENLLAALCAASIGETKPHRFLQAVQSIQPIPHRLEKVSVLRGITFINDSKGTNPDSTLAALHSLPLDKVILLLGGQRKQVSYETLFSLIENHRVRVITFGQDAQFFNEHLQNITPILGTKSKMSEATNLAFSLASSGDIVALSPGCASFDEFKNFEERGHAFRDAVSRLSA
ncbi:MAG: UDP-N-acetylmuramoyl-L-alanine--D-glutamate ligase [Candidatus Margulisiibacteriota bacterium]